jgi:hypothetical protein
MSDIDYIGMSSQSWPDPITGPWRIRCHFAWLDGRAECVGFDVRAFRSDETVANVRGLPRGTRPRAVTTEVIRSVPAAQVTGELRRGLEELTEFASRQTAQSKRKRAELARRRKQLAVSGRQLYDRGHFLAVAEVYEAAWREGENPTKAVADEFSTTRSAAGKWVYRARHEFGLLGPTEQRKAGGVKPVRKKR